MGFFSRLAAFPLWWLWTVLTRRKVLDAVHRFLFISLLACYLIGFFVEPLFRVLDVYVLDTRSWRHPALSLWLTVG